MTPKHSVVTNLARSTHSAHIAGDRKPDEILPPLAALDWRAVYELPYDARRWAIATRRVPIPAGDERRAA